ncbi:carboxypeptidase M32, partial [Rhodoferax sp.]|uniref:carboxypeptidase M32 n=1 Tax=Rhodoferax sp. TaxID=50421 RepID=UPI00276CF9E4|nr:carboxypeptidase M32 [Rhodoferax sp.]
MSPSAYPQLLAVFTRLHHFQHLTAIAWWDQSAMMPPKGNEARSKALAEMEVLVHQTITDPALAGLLDAAEQAPLDAPERASVREMRRQWALSNLLPARLVEAQSLAGSRCEHAWRSQRPANDWSALLPNLRTVVGLAREEAALLVDHFGGSRYEALMNKHEPGMRCAELDRIFAEVKSWLPALVRKVLDKQANESVLQPVGPFSNESQRALGLAVMKLLGFDFEAGRLDLSTHPFCAGVPEDVRITTRFRDDNFLQGLMGIIHETGHARYEQRLPRELVHLPIGRARTMGVHESQSLSFEMQLGRSAAFLSLITPLVHQHLGSQAALQADNLARLCTRVRPGFIRVDADELTYPAHVILRYEIERALIEGEIEVDDIPA